MKENLRVFIVDDSTVFRSQIRAALEGQEGIEVVGFATDGRMACEALKHKKVDVVTLDLEMPIMNGLETLTEINRNAERPHVIVFSAHSKAGAESTLAALRLGASDFLLKPKLESSNQRPAEVIRSVLLPKINQFRQPTQKQNLEPKPTPHLGVNWRSFQPEIVVLASSTGGPAALEYFFSLLKGPLNCPILIVQHMPPIFTATLAERLQKISGLPIREARNLDTIKKGQVYIAPGDFHMSVAVVNKENVIVLDQAPARNSVRPAADFLFETAAKIFKNATLGVVLTGMGYDGTDGALAIKAAGGGILIQNKESSVVFGMPGSIFEKQAYDEIGDIPKLVNRLAQLCLCNVEKDQSL